MLVNSIDAHFALNQLTDYCNHLDKQQDGLLILALNRLMNVFQSRLFLGLLDIQEFYETTLLDPYKTNEEKTNLALEVAHRWENIASPSLVASTTDLRNSNEFLNKLNDLDRSRSMYHINLNSPSFEQPCFLYGNQIDHDYLATNEFDHSNYSQANDYSNTKLSLDQPVSKPFSKLMRLNPVPKSSTDNHLDLLSSAISKQMVLDCNCQDKVPVAKPRHKRIKREDDNHVRTHLPNKYDSNHLMDYPTTFDADDWAVKNERLDLSQQCIFDKQWEALSRLPVTIEVVVEKGMQGFGFSIAGGHENSVDLSNETNTDIFVTRICEGGPANYQSGLQLGDRIVSVNGISLIGASHNEAVKALQLSGSRLKLIVERKAELATSEHDSLLSCSIRSQTHSKSAAMLSKTLSRKCVLDSATSTESGCIGISPVIHTSQSSTGFKSMSQNSELLPADEQKSISKTKSKLSAKSNTDLKVGSKTSRSCLNSESNGNELMGKFTKKPLECVNFPTFSWCGGLQKMTSGCASILNNVEHGQIRSKGSNSSIHTAKSNNHTRSLERIKSGLRPTPIPQPGPLVVEIHLTRGSKYDLGFSITGGVDNKTLDGDTGIFITKLTPGGVAELDGRLSIGDRIIQVNNTSLLDVTHEDAVKVLKQAGDQIRLVIIKQVGKTLKSMESDLHMPDQTKIKSINEENVSRSHHKRYKSLQNSTSSASSNSSSLSASTSGCRSPSTDFVHNHNKSANQSSSVSESKRRHKKSHKDLDRYVHDVPCTYASGQEMLEAQLAGLIDYTAATSVSNLISQWPKARLVTIYRSGRKALQTSKYPTSPDSNKNSKQIAGNLGFNIVGGDGSEATFVSHIQADKPAGMSKRIFVGDRLLAVNGLDVSKFGHEQAANALRENTDRVDLLLVYSPEEYADFEKHFLPQLKAVGHRISSRSLTRHPSINKTEGIQKASKQQLSVETNAGMYLRAQVDYAVNKDVDVDIPKKVFSFRSGDLFYVTNTTDPEWWQAQYLDPKTNQPSGRVGLIPSQSRLEYRECNWLKYVNFGETLSKHSNLPRQHSGKLTSIGSNKDQTVRCSASLHSLNASGSVHSSKGNNLQLGNEYAEKDSPRKAYKNYSKNHPTPLSYITVTPVQLSFARPVVILGHMKDKIADELICEFPETFGIAVPYTTRLRRSNEVEGRDYHFVVSREIMVADIAAHRYLEAGEYNGNLYGTHLESVFEIAKMGVNCLLDVGGPALRRLESVGLNPIALLILPSNQESVFQADDTKSTPSSYQKASGQKNAETKLERLLKHFTTYLTAIIITDDFHIAYARVKELIFSNSGPVVWLNSSQPIV